MHDAVAESSQGRNIGIGHGRKSFSPAEHSLDGDEVLEVERSDEVSGLILLLFAGPPAPNLSRAAL